MRAQGEWQARIAQAAAGLLECSVRQTEYLQIIAESHQAELVALAEIKALLHIQHPPEPGQAEGETESLAELLAGLAEDVTEIGTAAGFLAEEPEGG